MELDDRYRLDVDVDGRSIGGIDEFPEILRGVSAEGLAKIGSTARETGGKLGGEGRAEEGSFFRESGFGAKSGEIVVGTVSGVEEDVDEEEKGESRCSRRACSDDLLRGEPERGETLNFRKVRDVDLGWMDDGGASTGRLL